MLVEEADNATTARHGPVGLNADIVLELIHLKLKSPDEARRATLCRCGNRGPSDLEAAIEVGGLEGDALGDLCACDGKVGALGLEVDSAVTPDMQRHDALLARPGNLGLLEHVENHDFVIELLLERPDVVVLQYSV